MRKKRAFEYTDAEKQKTIHAYFDSKQDIDSFASERGISPDILQFWIDNSEKHKQSLETKHAYVTLLHEKDTIKCIYTEKAYFDTNHIINENVNPDITAIISKFFTKQGLKDEYRDQIGIGDAVTRSKIDNRIKDLLVGAGLDVHIESNVLSSEFLCKATMYNIDPDPNNFVDPPLSIPDAPAYPKKQTYLRVKPCHDYSRPDCRQWYIMILCVDKKLFDTTKTVQPDTELMERLKLICTGYTLNELYTPRHYKNYADSVRFWGESMMDYYNVNITDYMVNYIVDLLKGLGIEAITDNEELNQLFIRPT